MSLQLLDFILIGIMAVSGILALARGFTRELLSLVAWVSAAVAVYFALQQPKLLEFANTYTASDTISKVGVGAAVFVVVLIIASIISVKIADRVVDSSAGAFDRSLGFIFGLARGLLLVGLAFTLYHGFLQPKENREDWITNAKSLPVVERTSGLIIAAIRRISPDTADTLEAGNGISNPQGNVATPEAGDTGYNNGQTQGLENLVEGASGKTDQTATEPAPQ